jgi:hypothetical protein
MPAISPATANGTAYQVTSSKGLVATFTLPLMTTGASRELSVTYPTAAPALQVRLVKGAVSLALLPGAADPSGLTDTTTFANRRIEAGTGPGPSVGTTTLTCMITASAAPATDTWELRFTSTAAGSYAVTTTGTFPRIMCDPVAAFTISAQPGYAPGHAVEQSQVTLTANAPSPSGAPTIVGTPVPPIHYRWTCTGAVTVAGFPSCGTVNTFAFTTPAVASDEQVTIAGDVWYEGGCPTNVGWLNAGAWNPLTIEPRRTVQVGVHSTVGVDTWVRT